MLSCRKGSNFKYFDFACRSLCILWDYAWLGVVTCKFVSASSAVIHIWKIWTFHCSCWTRFCIGRLGIWSYAQIWGQMICWYSFATSGNLLFLSYQSWNCQFVQLADFQCAPTFGHLTSLKALYSMMLCRCFSGGPLGPFALVSCHPWASRTCSYSHLKEICWDGWIWNHFASDLKSYCSDSK